MLEFPGLRFYSIEFPTKWCSSRSRAFGLPVINEGNGEDRRSEEHRKKERERDRGTR